MLSASGLAGLDQRLFREINRVWTCALLDRLMPAITDLDKSRIAVRLALPAILALWIWRDRKKGPRAALTVVVAVGAADAVCHSILKPWVHRLRPEFSLSGVVLRAGSHSRFGFPSNHAANSFAAAVVLGWAYPRLRLTALCVAAVVAYSRVYVGAHFPADVLGGAIVGAAIGALASTAFLSRKPGVDS